jgi:hypothetical protein
VSSHAFQNKSRGLYLPVLRLDLSLRTLCARTVTFPVLSCVFLFPAFPLFSFLCLSGYLVALGVRPRARVRVINCIQKKKQVTWLTVRTPHRIHAYADFTPPVALLSIRLMRFYFSYLCLQSLYICRYSRVNLYNVYPNRYLFVYLYKCTLGT